MFYLKASITSKRDIWRKLGYFLKYTLNQNWTFLVQPGRPGKRFTTNIYYIGSEYDR